MYIHRKIEELIKNSLNKGKIIVLYGARQVGKTTLLNNLFLSQNKSIQYINCEELQYKNQLVPDSIKLKQALGEKGMVVFDEMQALSNPGLVLKIIHDQIPSIIAIATGSASFDLANKISEPLTGRHEQFQLYPFLFSEIAASVPPIDLKPNILNCLIYGSYPAVYNSVTTNEKIKIISILTDNYLYKDLLSFELIKNNHKVRELLIAIALQIGNEVSYHGLSKVVGLNYKTIERYLDLLEKSFVLFRLYGFSRNLRNEINKKVKIYFYDCGIRNALINNFNPLNMRDDSGALLENYIIAEKIKQNSNESRHANFYFWRTHNQQEIDLISEKDGVLSAYEIKSTKPIRELKAPDAFIRAYPKSNFEIISLDNFESIKKFLG
jgi:predicted AAA+ superfamily ATPase